MKEPFQLQLGHDAADALGCAWLRNDIDTCKINMKREHAHKDDIKLDKQIIKAAKLLLEYHGAKP